MTRWDDLGDLRRLLDPESLTALLRDGGIPATSAVPDHLRLKAGVNALVGLRIETASGRQAGYVRTYADPAQAGRAAQKWQRMRVDATTSGPGFRLLPGGTSVLFLFPNDARVRRLRLLAGRPRRLARVLADLEDFPQGRLGLGRTTFEVLRYKPERRLVACARLVVDEEPRTVVFRLRADGAGPELSMITRRLHAALGARVSRPLGLLFDGALVAEDVVPGTVLAAAVAADDADPEAAAEVIAALHTSGITLPDQLEASDILSRALAGLDLLTAVDPSIAPALRELRSNLVAALPPPRPPVSLHGDLHLDQIILGSSGPVVLDFERAATGPAGHDLGTLVAHLRAEGRDAFSAAFVDAYARTRGVNETDQAFFVGCGLVQRALLAFRSLRPEWQAAVPHLVELARQELAGRPRWDVAFPRRSGLWPAWTESGGIRRYGRWDPAARTLTDVMPHDDDALPGLGLLLAQGGSLTTYRPGQRAVVRLEGEDGARFVKVLPPRRAQKLVTRASALDRAAATPGFPQLAPIVDACPERGTVTFAELPGPTLRGLLLAGKGEDAIPAVAAAVVAFQGAAIPEEIGVRPGSSLDDWVGYVAHHAPGLAPSYQRVMRALPVAPVGEPPVLAHGDLHDGNVILTDGGVGLLDLDGVAAADPAEDVANLLAHLVLRAIQRNGEPAQGHSQGERFLAAYQTAGGVAPADAVAAATGRTLFRLACVHLFRGRWHSISPLLLHEALASVRQSRPAPFRSRRTAGSANS